MIIQQVVIADEKNGIGKDNQLLCHLPADLKHFKKLTTGYPVIMGRKTFESIGKPLPNRRNIVITSSNLDPEGYDTVHSLQDAIELCKGEERISVIGGATVYKQSIQQTDIIYLTRLHHQFDADVFFPEINPGNWEAAASEYHEADEKNPYAYTFITYTRR